MDALSPLYDLTSKPLYALCYSYFKNQQSAEDALSDTYLRAVKEINKFSGKSGFNWLYTIAKNICLNKLKRESREVKIDLQDEKTVNMLDEILSEEPTEIQDTEITDLAKKALNENEFKILIMHAVGGYKFKEIAGIFGKFEATVRWQYNNAIKKLKKELKKGGT